jgi:CheY-like chemotaxis protein
MPVRVLVVDDDRISNEIISKALIAKGIAVDSVESGFDAVGMIRSKRYDLALVDYQMPELDGLTSARVFRSLGDAKNLPRLVAITSDVASLKERAGAEDVFHTILPKPLKPDVIARFVDTTFRDSDRGRVFEAAEAFWRQHDFVGRPRAVAVPEPTPEQALALGLCFERGEIGNADLIVVTDPGAGAALERMRSNSRACLLPVIDVTGHAAALADAQFNVASPKSWSQTADVVATFARNRDKLAQKSWRSGDMEQRLLSYLFVSEKSFAPLFDASLAECVRYPGCFPLEAVAAAERLASRGLLTRKFVDRFHACASCCSHRLNVREECPSCRTSDIRETALIHHYKCAYQGPEEEFRSGSQLICPKCRAGLRHYGKDYDKPGNVLMCAACNAWNSEPAIGFCCLDCGAHIDGDAAPRRDVFSYELTPRAHKALTAPMNAADASVGLPTEVTTALVQLGLDPSASGRPFSIVQIVYGAERRLIQRLGLGAFDKHRRLFLENLSNALLDYARVVSTDEGDYVIAEDRDPASLPAFLGRASAACEETLSEKLKPACLLLDVPSKMGSVL